MSSDRQPCVTPGRLEYVEVSPRDGFQNERLPISTATKIELITRAATVGARRIEVASFVNPSRVPQMADAEAVVAGLPKSAETVYIGLALNLRGALRALATNVHEVGAVCVSTDAFAMRNQGQTSEESLAVAKEIVMVSKAEGKRAQVTIGASFGCPFEGEVDPDRIVAMAQSIAEAGPLEVALADTIGVAVPAQVSELVGRVKEATGLPVRVHFHNTRNMGIANVWAAVQAGASVVDGSIGGLGGCPFAPNSAGNVPTEDVVYMLDRSGISTGLDLGRTIETARWLRTVMGHDLPGMVSRAGGFPDPQQHESKEKQEA